MPTKAGADKITIYHEDGERTVEVVRFAYVKAKTQDLREFGYPSLTERHVDQCVQDALDGKEPADIIARFVEKDIVVEGKDG